ncbi:MAG: copper homeostasis protein CutC [Rhodobacterales bacterium]|nr:copper homeostasis protein CutC [Rhodobacterales bacterium]
MGLTLEVCVDTPAGVAAAVAGGADRLELCSALSLGGLTPSTGFMALAAGCGLPALAMIRPRAGGFVWTEADLAVMEADIGAARRAGLAGVVLGALLPDGRLDGPALRRLLLAAGGLDLTLHRCIDLVPDRDAALDEALDLGFHRVLTSGGALTAPAGASRIAALVARSAGRIAIMAGSGVTAETAPALKTLGVREFHSSCAESVAVSGRLAEMGFGPDQERRTSAARVSALRMALG